MRLDELSIGAQQIMQHLDDRKLDVGSYELPAQIEALFATAEDCRAAEQELSGRGLIQLGPPSPRAELATIRSVALTLDGLRLLRTNMPA